MKCSSRAGNARRAAAALLFGAALALAGCAATPAQPSAPPVTQPAALALEVSVAQAVALRDQGAFMLDVREPSEWIAGHISGATLIPLGQLSGRTGEVPQDRPVVVVCHTGNRSAQGRDILRGAGFTNVTSMSGGMNAWIAAGQPVVTGS